MSTYAELASTYDERRTRFLAAAGQAQATQELVGRLTGQVAAERMAAATAEQVATLFAAYSDAEHAQLIGRIEDLVSKGIEATFGPIYRFKVTMSTERGQASVVFSLLAADGTEHPVMDAQGGGLASIIGFLLRVVVLVLRPGTGPRLLVLDETFGMVSADYHQRLALFLRTLVDDLQLQVILITHAPEQGVYADLVYRVSKPNDRSVITNIGQEGL